MAHDFTHIALIAAGVAVVGAVFYNMMSANNAPNLTVGTSTAPPDQTWPMQRADPNITNAYNRAAYRDNTLKTDELYSNPPTNFTNDFLATYAPTVKQSHIPIQQL